jgi:hypothetical protein
MVRLQSQQQDPPLGDAGLQQLLDAGAASQHPAEAEGVDVPSQHPDDVAFVADGPQQAAAAAPAGAALPVTGNPLRAHFARPPSMLATSVKPWYIRK